MLQTFLNFSSGAIGMGFSLACLFFLRFWKSARDPLFLWFAAAFALLGIGQVMLTFTSLVIEERSPLFLLRLAAFLLIILGVWRKNLGVRRD